MSVVDPMHNFFLGTAKFVTQFWIQNEIFSKEDIRKIEAIVSNHRAPRSVGRLPSKISSDFAGFSADQWRNWTLIFSTVALKPVLSQEHMQYWLLFVKACTLLSARSISLAEVSQAHEYLNFFCCKFEEVNGAEYCTPNMHLHLHLKQCILDYGPLHTFWCYSFERYNGTLGHYPTNQKHIEPQLMKKCLLDQTLRCYNNSDDQHSFCQLLPNSTTQTGGCLLSASPELTSTVIKLSLPKITLDLPFVTGFEKLLPPIKEKTFEISDASNLHHLYNMLYPGHTVEHFSHLFFSSKRAIYCEELLGSNGSNSERSSYALQHTGQPHLLKFMQTKHLKLQQVKFSISFNIRLPLKRVVNLKRYTITLPMLSGTFDMIHGILMAQTV